MGIYIIDTATEIFIWGSHSLRPMPAVTNTSEVISCTTLWDRALSVASALANEFMYDSVSIINGTHCHIHCTIICEHWLICIKMKHFGSYLMLKNHLQ